MTTATASRINREEFIRALEQAEPGLSPREIVEQSDCFVFLRGRVVTYNDEVAVRAPSKLPKDLTGAVKAAPLLDVLRKMTADELEVSAGEGELVLTAKGRETVGVVMEANLTLPVDAVDKAESWSPLPDGFVDAVNLVQHCAGQNQTKFETTCVHIHPKWVEACDGVQLCRWRVKTGVEKATLVRALAIKHITGLGCVQGAETASWVHYKNPAGVVLSCRRYLEEYPDLTHYFKQNGGHPAALPKQVGEAADRAGVFSKENEIDLVEVWVDRQRVRVESRGVHGRYSKTLKAKYGGSPLHFSMSPAILREIVTKYNEVILSEQFLRVEGTSYTYLTCLHVPAQNGEASAGEGGEE